jgi:Stage II sporulation protein E (SpoIIE)
VTRGNKSASFTSEFGREFEVERQSWLHTRFLWYTGVVALLWTTVFVIGVIVQIAAPDVGPFSAQPIAGNIASVLTVAVFSFAHAYVRRRTGLPRQRLVRLVLILIVAGGLLQLISPAIKAIGDAGGGGGVGAQWLATVFFFHLFACMFLPLTAKESLKPLVPLLAINAILMLIGNHGVTGFVWVALTPLIGAPGAIICSTRHGRFRRSFTFKAWRGRYTDMKRELVDARRLHEALFPPQIIDGPIRFAYAYEPMSEIGGDYLFVNQRHADGGDELSVVLLDVTGHGIPAALTVNRLHGELERIFAEMPDIDPGRVLQLLNRYVHLTLATHSVYVTGLCLRVRTETNELDFASGGHPPAFLRAVDGSIEELGSTALVLGAARDDDFEPEPITLRFGQGDTLLAYTDGAMEARDSKGKFFGIDRLRALLATGRPDLDMGWPETILAQVDGFRFGAAADDTLVFEVTRPIDVEGLGQPSAAVSASESVSP